ncbi:hypothetical protein [Ekhidna sp.]|uniref:hypothetical protein n=1 Tax=Ekhidna sp. TaxID=2608089 RepID=UPI0032EBBE78
MELHIKIIGVLLIVLGLIHIIFPKYFNWKAELQSLSLINRQVMMVHTFFIALTVILMGLLCLTSTNELVKTTLGKRVSFGFGVFWSFRLLIQLFVYSVHLWKGKKFETFVHVIFTCAWIYLSVVFITVGITSQ